MLANDNNSRYQTILLSMLFKLLLVRITVLLCFFVLFLVVFNSFFTNPVVIENARLQLAFINSSKRCNRNAASCY